MIILRFFKRVLLHFYRFYYYVYYLRVKFFKLGSRVFLIKCPFVDLRIRLWRVLGNIVGEDVHVNYNITLMMSDKLKHNLIIGDRVAFGPHSILIMESSPNDSRLATNMNTKKYCKTAPIKIGDDTWIGANCVIHPGVTIGKNCIIGAMSNVTKDVPDNSMGWRNPFQIVKRLHLE